MPQALGALRSDRKTAPHNETTTNPGVSDDSTAGYEIGALWINTTADTCYVCLDASSGAAVWKELTSTAGSETTRWTTKVKLTDETLTNDNSLNNDADLQFTTSANTNYLVRALIVFESNATPDFQWAIAHSGTTTQAFATSWRIRNSDTVFTNIAGLNAPATGNPLTTNTVDVNFVWIHYFLRVGGSGGTVNFQWAQNTSDANNTIVRAGSYFEYISEAP